MSASSDVRFSPLEMDSIALLDVTQAIESKINALHPEIIYTHHIGDLNIDHQITHKAVMTACRPQPDFCVKEIYTFEVEMRYSDLSVILANQKGLIKIAPDKYGWIMSLTIGEKENKADIRLLRANLNVVTPT
jgi:LmbE family N-acetylglucosaminyl deacetylase